MPTWLADLASANWAWFSVASFLLFAAAETMWPDSRKRHALLRRWTGHFAIYVSDILLTSIVLPGFAAALLIEEQASNPVRVFGAIARVGGPWVMLAVGLLAIDGVIYWSHRLQHRVDVLWRFHAVHHSDEDMDVSTALRHHPVAYVVSAAITSLVLIGLGLPAWVFPVYGLFEIAVGAFQHAASPIPDRLERALRWLIVTPGMHQAHHSADTSHYDHNFANVLSFWDRLFGTFLVLPASERSALRFGVDPYTGGRHRGTAWAMSMPFRMNRSIKARAPEPVE